MNPSHLPLIRMDSTLVTYARYSLAQQHATCTCSRSPSALLGPAMRAASRTVEGKKLHAIRLPLSVFPPHVASSPSTYTQRTTTPLVSHMVPSHQLAYSPHWRRPRSELSGPVSRSTFNVCAHGSSFPSEDPADVQMPAFANLALLRSRHYISVFVLPLSAASGSHVTCSHPLPL
jgi:hypothetical protein